MFRVTVSAFLSFCITLWGTGKSVMYSAGVTLIDSKHANLILIISETSDGLIVRNSLWQHRGAALPAILSPNVAEFNRPPPPINRRKEARKAPARRRRPHIPRRTDGATGLPACLPDDRPRSAFLSEDAPDRTPRTNEQPERRSAASNADGESGFRSRARAPGGARPSVRPGRKQVALKSNGALLFGCRVSGPTARRRDGR